MNDKYTCMTCGQRIRLEPPVKLDAACPACQAVLPYDVIETANEITPDMPVCACPRCQYEGRHHPGTLCPRCHERELSPASPDQGLSHVPLQQGVQASAPSGTTARRPASPVPANLSGLVLIIGVLDLVASLIFAFALDAPVWAAYGIMALIGCLILANILNHLHYISSNINKS